MGELTICFENNAQIRIHLLRIYLLVTNAQNIFRHFQIGTSILPAGGHGNDCIFVICSVKNVWVGLRRRLPSGSYEWSDTNLPLYASQSAG